MHNNEGIKQKHQHSESRPLFSGFFLILILLLALTGNGDTAALDPEGHPLHHRQGRVGVVVGRNDDERVVDANADEDEGEDLRQRRERYACRPVEGRKENQSVVRSSAFRTK